MVRKNEILIWAIFVAQIFGFQTPSPLPPSSLRIHPLRGGGGGGPLSSKSRGRGANSAACPKCSAHLRGSANRTRADVHARGEACSRGLGCRMSEDSQRSTRERDTGAMERMSGGWGMVKGGVWGRQ